MFFSFQEVLESIQLMLPEFLVVGQPFLCRPKGGGIETDDLKAATPFARDQFRGFQDFEVLGYRSQGDTVRLGNLADGLFFGCDVAKNRPARGVGKSVKDRI
jgi:hypothetical protein